ncbi:hypothetical protein [Wolbachia endosymbiont of Mansonella perstans]|uniref:hypothetical protein n=1 Tax=Wolbachia endosymbiont of Mansonella perstans TaxID=229526 RepID=UPI001CE0A6C7|nr:hypothetical protein [Wolbachia endosymbiont of Mansonella perstans]MCA4774403.1 hypothetical protein [Wolbachia endosymbiont of Mansonella perstans]
MDCADPRNLFKEGKQQEEILDPVALISLFDESPSSESQPTKSENGGIFYDIEPSEEKSTRNRSTQNGQSRTEWGIDTAKAALRGTIFATVQQHLL